MKKAILLILLLSSVNYFAEARQPQRGYRGFIEWSNLAGRERVWTHLPASGYWFTGVSTTHGYQINPVFFAGVGLEVDRNNTLERWVVPLFAEGRADLKFGNLTPFASVRAGVNVGEGVGAYFSPSVGYRFNFGRKFGVNIAAGYTLAGYKVDCYDISLYDNQHSAYGYNIQYVKTEHRIHSYFSFRLGFDF